ncbi:MAG: BrnT family toxin [Rhodanobacteraceae bacterium]
MQPAGGQWDARKAKSNLEKHGVGFEEAATVFGDTSSLTIADAAHSQREERFISLGNSEGEDCWSSCIARR